jgi:protein-tyrosine phosphatase
MPHTIRLLFVCAGNICRSPMAEAFMRRSIAERDGLRYVEVFSAGTIAADGGLSPPQTLTVMRANHRLELSGHRARRLSRNLRADLVLTMDRAVTKQARGILTHGDVQLIGDFAGSPGEEVADPYGGSVEDHAACAAQIERLAGEVAARLEREAAEADQAGAAPDPSDGAGTGNADARGGSGSASS